MALLDPLVPYQLEGPSNPYLVRAMQAVAAHDTQETRRELYTTLLQSTLLLPTPTAMAEGIQGYWSVVSPDANMRLITAQSPTGEPLLIAFTDIEALRAWRPEGIPYFLMRAPDVFVLAARNHMPALILNPAGPTSGQITRWEIERLAQGVIPDAGGGGELPDVAQETVNKEARVLIGAPLEPPSDQLITVLRESLGSQPEIQAGYLFQMILNETDVRLVVGLRLEEPLGDSQVRVLMQMLLSRIHPSMVSGQPLDFLVLEEGGQLLQVVEKMVQPFFLRF